MMKVIILAAGYATRLYPLTKKTPKQLLLIGNKLMLDHLIDKVCVLNPDSIHVVVNSTFRDQFLSWAAARKEKIDIIDNGVTSEENKRGAVGDFAFALEQRAIDDDVLVLGGDNLFEFNLGHFWSSFLEKGSSIAVYDLKDPALLARKFGVVEMDKHNRILGFEEKPEFPKSSMTATLIYALSKENLSTLKEYVHSSDRPDNAGMMIKWLAENHKVMAWPFRERWVDIGSFEDLERIRKEYS
ncbi:MAG: nucleotidyltransferase family protein [Candidatus Woesearchaeota archaeon]